MEPSSGVPGLADVLRSLADEMGEDEPSAERVVIQKATDVIFAARIYRGDEKDFDGVQLRFDGPS